MNVACRPVLTAQECATRLMTSIEYHRLLQQPNPKVIEIEKMMIMVNDTVNFVCRDNVERMEFFLTYASSNFSINLKSWLYFIFLFYDWPFLHVRNLEENLLFYTLVLGSVFSDYVVFCGNINFILL